MLPLLGKYLKTVDGKPGFTMKMYNDPPPTEGKDARVALDERVLDLTNQWFVDYNHPELAEVWYAEAEAILTPEASGEWEFGLSVHGTARFYIDGELVVANDVNQRRGSSFLGAGTVEEVGSKSLEAGKEYRVVVKWGCSKTSALKATGVVDFGQGGLRFSGCPKLDPAQAIQDAVQVAQSVDQVVLCIGTSGEWESEGQDRTSMALPPEPMSLFRL